MKTFTHRGTTINKIDIFEFIDELNVLDLDPMDIWSSCGDGENDHIYVSNGFLRALNNPDDVVDGEWHHFFMKQEDGTFEAGKFNFNNKVSNYEPF